MGENPHSSEHDFCEVWRESWEDCLSQADRPSPVVSFREAVQIAAPAPADAAKSVTVWFTTGGNLNGDLVWSAEPSVVLQLGQLSMSEPLDPAVELTDAHREAFAKCLRRVADHASTKWKQKTRSDTEFTVSPSPKVEVTSPRSFLFHISTENGPEVSLRLDLTKELAEALAASQTTSLASDGAPSKSPSALPPNLALLLEIEIEARIRVGDKEMLLRDLQGLMPGAVVEMEQMVYEPVSLYVAGRKVARGEIIVVDGNFGLRITEVATLSHRVQVLQS